MEYVAAFCLALDLKDNPALIAEYKTYHQQVWQEISSSKKDSGIIRPDIYCIGNRMFMIIEAAPDFSFDNKAANDFLLSPNICKMNNHIIFK